MKNVHVEHETIHIITYSWVYLFSIYLKFSHLRFMILQLDVLGLGLDTN